MYIGKAALASGASIKAIRLYENQGLIALPTRQGNYRVYDSDRIAALRCIKQAQSLGFSLKEIKSLVGADHRLDVSRFEQAIEARINAYEALIYQSQQRISSLQTMRYEVLRPKFCDAS